jgi:hypothetical protein
MYSPLGIAMLTVVRSSIPIEHTMLDVRIRRVRAKLRVARTDSSRRLGAAPVWVDV